MDQSEKENLLIVDDCEEYLMGLKRVLRRPDLNIETADSGEKALQLITKHDFAVIIMDVIMPEMDGFEIAEQMRKNPDRAHIPIIFVTGLERNQDRMFKGYEAGAVDFLYKPINTNVLRSKINIFLDMHRQKEQLSNALSELEASYDELKESRAKVLELERRHAVMAMVVTANHELNQPLTVMGGYLEMLQNTLPQAPLSDKQEKCFKKIKCSYERIKAILVKFNEFSALKLEDYIGERQIVVFEDEPDKK